jgi:vancomycin resistance protein VanJ
MIHIRSLFRSRLDLLSIVPLALVAFALLTKVLPPGSGPTALALVLEVHLFIVTFAILAPIALLARVRVRALGLAVLLLAVTGAGLFGSEWISLPGGGAGRHDLTVMSWNVQFGSRTPAQQAAQLEEAEADLIDLQELEPDAAAAITGDAVLTARYPYRAMAPRPLAGGLAVLSKYPLSDVSSTADPASLGLVVATPRGPVHLIVAHPTPANISTITPLRLPVGYDPTERDHEIATVRTRIDAALGTGERLVVLGDFNTAPSEAEYPVLTRGLRDTHVEVGEGPGWTWRPSRLTVLPVAFLRIDLQLSAGAIRPAATSVDCSLPGDHCRLFGVYEID